MKRVNDLGVVLTLKSADVSAFLQDSLHPCPLLTRRRVNWVYLAWRAI